jgi:hypothetical protein
MTAATTTTTTEAEMLNNNYIILDATIDAACFINCKVMEDEM